MSPRTIMGCAAAGLAAWCLMASLTKRDPEVRTALERPSRSTPAVPPKPEPPRMRPGDSFLLKVADEPDLDGVFLINRQGETTLPLTGAVKIGGLTSDEAALAIELEYRKHHLVIKPSVMMVTFGGGLTRFTILGQVTKPGAYSYPAGDRVTLIQALGYAGGFTKDANQTDITIDRAGSKIHVNARKLVDQKLAPVFLTPGDVINVPESPSPDPAEKAPDGANPKAPGSL